MKTVHISPFSPLRHPWLFLHRGPTRKKDFMEPETSSKFLFTNFGTVRPSSAEETRLTHNATIGDPASVAAVQALGDLSHLVHVPLGEWTGELVLIDQWTSAEGIQQFLANPKIREHGQQLFSISRPGVWRLGEGFVQYTINTPARQTNRFLALLHGPVTSLDAAQRAYNQVFRQRIGEARKLGLVTHELFIRIGPGTPDSVEILGIDSWFKLDGPRQLYADPQFQAAFTGVFTRPPQTWVLHRPEGDWIEW